MGKRAKRIKNSVRRWVDYDRFVGHAAGVKAVLAKLLAPQSPKRQEGFDQAVKRLKLKSVDIQKRMYSLKRLAIVMLAMASVIFIYTIYNAIRSHWIASILSFILFLLTLVLAFRYHFWYFQLKQRRLGATFGQWVKVNLLNQSDNK